MTRHARAAVVATLISLAPAMVCADPATDYVLHCRGCHGPSGGGIPPEVPDLRAHPAGFAGTERGRAFLVGVPGVAQADLDDERLAELLTWLVREMGRAPSTPAFTVEEIARLRRPPIVDVARRRAEVMGAAGLSDGSYPSE